MQNKEITDVSGQNLWLKWAIELQSIAQAGLTYSKDIFDLERFKRIREISAEIMSLQTGMTVKHIKDIFCNETGFQTPKLDTRAAIFQDNKILLVKEKNGTWSLPGGWMEVNESIRSNTIKEVKEESGFDVIPLKLIAVQDRNKHNTPLYAYGVCKVFVLCEIIGGEFETNIETVQRGFFDVNVLPSPLATEKNNEEQIKLCFQACQSENWTTVFD
ncbi:MAG: NUDIX hydrolase [Prevotellaceae bacterium]|jgi:ADP-ribose pyrophosphatase YjhB (NUDIX family)|nr:NUDIX hydrolase [Prevotellaceae bacterium]